jgi:DNA-binding helix-hairpin-helix protein with protein kinase domain
MVETLICAHTAQPLQLTRKIASSGEGTVWQTSQAGQLAKLYHTSTEERQAKLRVMVAKPPVDPLQQARHTTFAWPQDLIKNTQGQILGFMMPEIGGAVKLSSIYNPRLRNQIAPRFNWFYLYTAALNYALAVQSLHESNYVIGDVKAQNILVTRQALISIIDTDSFQIKGPDGYTHRCLVGSEGFTPPELLGIDLSTVDQTKAQDNFRIAIVIYLLLFGDHPFKGKWIGQGEAPLPAELIRRGFWPYAPGSLIAAGPTTIPLSILHPALQDCFQRCFTTGHLHPDRRPDASEWAVALQQAISELQVCDRNNNHVYSQTHRQCYWCQRHQILKLDIFEGVTRRKPALSQSKPSYSNLSPSPSIAYSIGQTSIQSQFQNTRAPNRLLEWIFSVSPKCAMGLNFIVFLGVLIISKSLWIACSLQFLFWIFCCVGFCPGIGEITLAVTGFWGVVWLKENIMGVVTAYEPMTSFVYTAIISGLWAGFSYRKNLKI